MASFSRRVIVDIGASAIRVGEVLPDRKGMPILRQLGGQELDIDPSKTAEFFPTVLQQLENLIRSSGIKPGPACLCLGGPSVFSRVIKIPQTDPNQVKQMVGYEAQQAIPAIEEACWDFQLFPSGGGTELEAMILAIKKDSIEEMVVAGTKAGLQVDSVELAPAAIINAFRYNYPEISVSTLILEVGARSTNIVIVEGEKIFCRIVPLGGASISQAIATDLQESFAGAETLKKAKGFIHPGGSYEDPADETAGRISKLARGVITRLHTEVERSITFYRSQQGGSRPALVLLAGGGAGIGLMDFFFKEKLKVPVQFFQSFRRIGMEGGISLEVQRNFTAWTCFVGTALRVLPETPCRINVITHLQNDSLSKMKDRPAKLVAGIAASAVILLPGIHGYLQARKIDETISTQRGDVEEAESISADLQTSKKKFSDQLAILNTAIQLQEERMRWPELLAELAKRSRVGMWITRLAVVPGVNESKLLASKGKPGKPPPAVTQLEISGIFETKSEVDDAQVVDLFAKSLEESGVLQKIETVERETPERSPDGTTEQVALKFTLRGEWIPRQNDAGQLGGKSKPK